MVLKMESIVVTLIPKSQKMKRYAREITWPLFAMILEVCGAVLFEFVAGRLFAYLFVFHDNVLLLMIR